MASLIHYVSSVRRSKSFWGLADQAVLSLGTFVTNIALMRAYKYNADAFGVYAMLITTIAFLNNLHQSVVTYPLSVRGALAPVEGLRRLTTTSLLLTVFWSIPLQLILFAATYFLNSLWLYPYVAVALFGWQCQETTRRALMAHLRHDQAIWGDAISYLGQAVVVIALCYHRVPALQEIFIVIAVTSFLAAAVQGLQLRLAKSDGSTARAFGLEAWRIGRWPLMSNGLSFLTIQAVGWVILGAYRGDEGHRLVAVFQALSNLMGVSHPVMFGISGLIVPGVAKARKELGDGAAQRYAAKLSALGLALLSPYFLFLLITPHLAIRLFCGPDSPYQQYAPLLMWFVVQYVMIYLSFVTASYLNALEESRYAFYGQLANAVVSTTVRLPLAALWGVGPAIWGGIFTYGANVLVNVWGLRSVHPPRDTDHVTPALVLEVEV